MTTFAHLAMASQLVRTILPQSKRFLPSINVCCHSSSLTKKTDSQVRIRDEEKDEITHTGQKYNEGDFRLARYVGREKEINKNFAIDLIAEVPPIAVKARTTHCDGGNGPLGHPRVFINLDQPGNHSCSYCGLRFYQDTHGH